MIEESVFMKIPTWKDGQWIERTIFQTREAFISFVLSCFKVPGHYEFDETAYVFNEQARNFISNGFFTKAPQGSQVYSNYWDTERRKCRRGAIFINNGKTWYLPRDYYMWINFMMINNKERNRYTFIEIRDTQLHLALYELLAELHYKHCTVVKKRQIASSYYHMAKFINQLYFEEGPVLKMGASLMSHVDNGGTWKFIEEYRSFLNKHTGWYRDFNPGGESKWQQQVETTDGNGRKTMVGYKGTLVALSFESTKTKGVGGPCRYFFYEEAGEAPTMDITFEFLRPAMQSGLMTTGMFIAAGSVGELSQCNPLKDFLLNPDNNGMYAVEHNLMDGEGTHGRTALFIPEQWSMQPCIDKYGNSQVEEAERMIDEIRAVWKAELTPERYRYRISQHPKNIKEAFDFREESVFPLDLVMQQEDRIKSKDYAEEYVDLRRNSEGTIEVLSTTKTPITEFPVNKKAVDKEGVIVVYERPRANPKFGDYYASIDPVSEGNTLTSDSLCSIYVYKSMIQVSKDTPDGREVTVERDGIVAAWCGRFDDINKTHERLELIIEWYNSWTLIENNVSLFIQHMIHARKQRYLVPKSQIAFLKELKSNTNVFQEYGWKNTGQIFRSHLLSYLIEWLKEEIDVETKPDGTIVKITHGIERLPDIMALREMYAYTSKANVDRLVSLAALIAFVKLQESYRAPRVVMELSDTKGLDKSKKLTKLDSGMFRNIERNSPTTNYKASRSGFKNIR